MYVCLCAYACQDVGVFVSCCIWMYGAVFVSVFTYVCKAYVYKYLYMYACIPAHTYMYIHVYKSTFIHFCIIF